MAVIARTIVDQYKKRNNLVQQIHETKQLQLQGESMLPILNPREISVLFVTKCMDYKVGDIVVFEYKRSLFGVAVHRIIKKREKTITTKGDNNPQSDETVDTSDIIGKIEKALTNNSTIMSLKTSRIIAMLSRFESYVAPRLSKRASLILHHWLIKIYRLVVQKRGGNV